MPAEMTDEDPIPEAIRETLSPTISRLVAALPMHELHVIVKEAMACEVALEREIETLERELNIRSSNSKKSSKEEDASPLSPLKEPVMNPIPLLPTVYQPNGGDVNYLESVDDILDTEFTPPDRYFTISALLGRLREPLKLPHPPNSRLHAHSLSIKSKKNDPVSEERKKQLALEKQQALLALDKDVAYHADHPDTTVLLALHKKISGHRTSAVFRKPVNPLEAPGYKERILFPMDLSLIRKMIVARMIKSYANLHQRIALICHNCVKFNGRESDYAILTREFEDYVDEKILEVVRNASGGATGAAIGINL